MAKSLLSLLKLVRRSDDIIGEAVSEIAVEVLTQWHLHGNKNPHDVLKLAIHGGVDERGLFGAKGESLRGVSAGVARCFSGITLGKRQPDADIEVLAQLATDKGMATRAEHREWRAERKAAKAAADEKQAARDAKAEADELANKIRSAAADAEREALLSVRSSIVLPTGQVVALTAEELAGLMTTLTSLRAAQAADAVEPVTA